MMPPPSHETQPRLMAGDDSVLGACRASVATLQRLLDLLFPDDPPPDILRVEDVLKRYPFTGLGAPATAAIEQSRRIIRTRRDFTFMGLAEFHAGLIYLYWGDSYAAAQQFAAARSQWTLAGHVPSSCLSHFAQGLALQHGYHLEAAMSQFGMTTRCLNRKYVGPQASQMGLLIDELSGLLAGAQEAIRPDLWPREAPREVAAAPGAAPPPSEPGPGESSSTRDEEPDRQKAVARESSSTPQRSDPSDRSRRRTDGQPIPPPISNLLRKPATHVTGPIPGHSSTDERYRWFVVHKRRDGLLPELTEGTLVLIDRDGKVSDDTVRELVIFGAPGAAAGSIMVKPLLTMAAGVSCYLGYLMPDPSGDGNLIAGRPLLVDDSGRSVRVPGMVLLGLVVGFWHNVIA